MKDIDPLIVFDTTKVYDTQPKINENSVPDFIKLNGVGVYIRAVTDINQSDWNTLKNNIAEPENHNFTFDWNIDNYKDVVFEKKKKTPRRLYMRLLRLLNNSFASSIPTTDIRRTLLTLTQCSIHPKLPWSYLLTEHLKSCSNGS